MTLYHAISTYQLLCAIVHSKEKKEDSILVLPDFIVSKFPHYRDLVIYGFFKEVYLFPYLQIAHNPNTILDDVQNAYENTIPYEISNFKEIYVLGAHFYFSLYLIKKKKKFVYFEDAAGMIQRSEEMYLNLQKNFPVHANIARDNGLFDGTNKYVKRRMCLNVESSRDFRFNIGDYLARMSQSEMDKILSFFKVKKIEIGSDAKKQALLLTQQFVGLGAMSIDEQKEIYMLFADKYLKVYDVVYVKKHPDDKISYQDLIPRAIEIDGCFPAELIPYVLNCGNNVDLYTISSTSFNTIKHEFEKKISIFEENDMFISEFNNQYDFFKRILLKN